MDTQLITRKFARIGARAELVFAPGATLAVDVGRDPKDVEAFAITLDPRRVGDLLVLDARPDDRHLLLAARTPAGLQRFLCGHDERHWFVAAVPENAGASSVPEAKEALKPRAVRLEQIRRRVRFADRQRRKTAAYVRQGEWFFIPRPGATFPEWLIRRNEPLQRTGGPGDRPGKPHIAQFAYRDGGQWVYVHRDGHRVISPERHRQLVASKITLAGEYRPMRAGMRVFVRGSVRHPDHATLHLRDWHEVIMNTEHESVAMRFVRFID